MSERLVVADPCWGCQHRRYVGEGAYECLEPGQTCEVFQNVEWATGLVATIADAIAVKGESTREMRETAAVLLADALTDILSDLGARLDEGAFLRRAAVPSTKESECVPPVDAPDMAEQEIPF